MMPRAFASDAKVVMIIDMALEGKSITEMMIATSLSKAVVKYWRQEALDVFKAADCGCGRQVGHRGQCSAKAKKKAFGTLDLPPAKKIVIEIKRPPEEDPIAFEGNDDFVPVVAGRPYRLVKAGLA